MAWIRMSGGASAPKFKPDGLTSSNATIVSGGYRLNGDTCEIDIVFQTTSSVSTNSSIVSGFPVPINVATNTFFNEQMSNCQMYKGAVQTGIFAKANIASGTTIHFVTAYKWR